MIREDDGWKSYRHRRNLRKLEPEHDPLENTNLSEVDVNDDDEIPQIPQIGKSQKENSANQVGKSHTSVGCGNNADKRRRSSRLFMKSNVVKKVSCLT